MKFIHNLFMLLVSISSYILGTEHRWFTAFTCTILVTVLEYATCYQNINILIWCLNGLLIIILFISEVVSET